MEWDSTVFVIRSKYRKRVFLELTKPKRPSEIAKSLGLRLTHATRALRELKHRDLVRCLNPKENFARFYDLTTKGKSILKEVKKLGGS